MTSALKKILCPAAILQITDGKVFFKENASGSVIKKLTIQGLHPESLVFTLDKMPSVEEKLCKQFSVYLNSSTIDINQKCDLIIIHGDCVIIADLKSKKIKDHHGSQLLNSGLIFDYIGSLAKEYYDVDISRLKRKHILFSGQSISPTERPKTQKSRARNYKSIYFKVVDLYPTREEAIVNIRKLLDCNE